MRPIGPYLHRYTYRLLGDKSIPRMVRKMIDMHLRKPWIHGFVLPIIRSGQSSLPVDYFDMEIVDGWCLPSKKWWLAHAHASHPPDGSGCDVDVHTKFLSSEGAIHEFDYAALTTEGIYVLGQQDFETECAWWAKHVTGTGR